MNAQPQPKPQPTFIDTHTLAAAAAWLIANFDRVRFNSRTFVDDLLRAYAKYGNRLTPGRAHWIVKMAAESGAPGIAAPGVAPVAVVSPAAVAVQQASDRFVAHQASRQQPAPIPAPVVDLAAPLAHGLRIGARVEVKDGFCAGKVGTVFPSSGLSVSVKLDGYASAQDFARDSLNVIFANDPAVAISQPAYVAPTVKAQTLSGTGCTRLIQLFALAAAKLKRPRINIKVTIGTERVPLHLRLASPHSTNADHLYVYGVTPGFSRMQYIGKVSPTGEWQPVTRICTDVQSAAVHRFSADPIGAASEHGKLTGSCCFCRKTLTDARSAAVGYGAICAGHYGLPWGSVRIDATAALAVSP